MSQKRQRPIAAHVRAATAAAQRKAAEAASGTDRVPAPHVQRAIGSPQAQRAAFPLGGRAVQLKVEGLAPHVQRMVMATAQATIQSVTAQKPGPHFRPSEVSAAQPKIGTPGPLWPNQGHAVIQPSREHIPDTRELPGMMVPDLEMQQYAEHVRNRVLVFFILTARAFRTILSAGGQVPRNLFSDHARAQIGSGYRGPRAEEEVRGELRFDAAHFMNTTLNKTAFAAQTGLGEDHDLVQGLYELSAATSDQFQTSNITADKVFDRLMREYKGKMIAHCRTTNAWTDDDIRGFLDLFLKDAKAQTYAKAKQYHESETTRDIEIKLLSYFAAAGVAARMLGDIEVPLTDILREL